MLIQHLALVSKSKKIKSSQLSQAAAALQKQATRDLGPIWGIHATVDYFPNLKSVPLGYWPIIISEKINEPGAAGYHDDKHQQPFALVELNDTWQLTCSHEMCEMLVDPYGRRLVTGDSIKKGQGRVQYLVEVCDPCEDASFAYSVNGLLLSDFYTPHYVDPVANRGTRYSYTGAISKPREIKKNGYLSWRNPSDNKWYQANYFGNKPVIKVINGMEEMTGSLRSRVDRLTKNPNQKISLQSVMKTKGKVLEQTVASSEYSQLHWEDEMKILGV